MSTKPSPPSPPDPIAVSNAQSAANIASATAQQKLNMVNSTTPQGTVNYTADGSAPSGYASTTTYSPPEQALFDKSTGLQSGALDTAGTALAHANSSLGSNLTPPTLGTSAGFDQAASDATYNQAASRLNPQWQRAQSQKENQLANQGLNVNDEAYTNAMQDFNFAKNDAYTSANNQATVTGANLGLQQGGFDNAAAQQGFTNTAYAQNQPIDQFSALLGLGQVATPTGVGYTPSSIAPTDVTGAYALNTQAQQAAYQSKSQNYQATLGGLFNLGSAAIMSDRRLKRDVRKVGVRPDGLLLYAFKYLWSEVEHIGVMAQDVLRVKPWAVHNIGGWLAVDYGALDV